MNPVEIAVVPAKDGFEWLRLSFRLFRMQWLRYVSITAVFILILQFAGAITAGILSAFLLPVLKVGFLAAAWHQERGETPLVSHLFAGFKSNLKALLPIGLFCVVMFHVAARIALWVAGIDVTTLPADPAKMDPKLAESLIQFAAVFFACLIPLFAAMWFAPALVVFEDASFVSAIKGSLEAWTKNILAITVYCASLVLAQFAIAMFLAILALLMGVGVAVFAIPLFFVPLTAVVMISDYVSYRRVFHRSERLQATTR
jgi:hypothetical protein